MMEESTTYQATLASEARKILLLLGTRRLGAPDDRVREVLEVIRHPAQLELWIDRLDEASNWSELLELPSAARTSRRRSRR